MDLDVTRNASLKSAGCSEASRAVFLALVIFYVLLIPLFGYVLYVGGSEWRKQRYGPSKRKLGHSDVLTFNMVAVESVNILGLVFLYASSFRDEATLLKPGDFLYMLASFVQLWFHTLICLERYAAVVHPVAYLRLRSEHWRGVRNVSIGAIWLLSGGILLIFSSDLGKKVVGLLFNLLSVPVISFCSVSVLRVLIRPAPGDEGGDRKRVDQSKRAAFDTIMTILGALLLRFVVVLAFYADAFTRTNIVNNCIVTLLIFWLKIPSSLVLPLLFLHRARKLLVSRQKT